MLPWQYFLCKECALNNIHSHTHLHHAQSMLMFMIMIMVMRATSKCNAVIKMIRIEQGMASHGTMIHWLWKRNVSNVTWPKLSQTISNERLHCQMLLFSWAYVCVLCALLISQYVYVCILFTRACFVYENARPFLILSFAHGVLIHGDGNAGMAQWYGHKHEQSNHITLPFVGLCVRTYLQVYRHFHSIRDVLIATKHEHTSSI